MTIGEFPAHKKINITVGIVCVMPDIYKKPVQCYCVIDIETEAGQGIFIPALVDDINTMVIYPCPIAGDQSGY
jgi:hypothetical protein